MQFFFVFFPLWWVQAHSSSIPSSLYMMVRRRNEHKNHKRQENTK
uniref:Uncharacterized protein n=1 Tax=Anguilla anguilla TaxID=7936 RepID=A0A0E9S389_ANGAN